jgi:hypothetical protein
VNKKILILLILLIFKIVSLPAVSFADENTQTKLNELYEKPGGLDFFTNIPRNLKSSWDKAFNTRPATLWTWGAILSSSVIFYIYDEKIYNHAQKLGRSLGLGNNDHTKTLIKINDIAIFRGPTDLASSMYFIGDGWTQGITAASFAIYGSLNDNNRAMQTGSQIMNSLLSGSIPTQIIKRATGREDPYRTTEYRGKWKFFSDRYDDDVSAHDAVPSGHLMAVTSTLTVIDTNYPEYRHIIRPLAISLLTLVSFQMVNLGVHWISDYPLGMGIGYVTALSALEIGRKNSANKLLNKRAQITNPLDWKFIPSFTANSINQRTYGLTGIFNF